MKNLGSITNDEDITTKKYVDDADDLKVDKSSVIQTLSSGTKIGEVNGTNLYAPSPGGGSQQVWYGTSPTGDSTATKVVTTTTGDFEFKAGNVLFVKFAYGNTSSSNLSVKVDGTTKNLYVGQTRIGTYYWDANETLALVYSGSYFFAVNQGIATTLYYGATKLVTSPTSTLTTAAATPSAVKRAYDRTLTRYKEIITSYASGWNYYGSTGGNKPTLRVSGNVVNLRGAMTNTVAKTLNASGETAFSISTTYAPEVDISTVFNGSGTNRYNCTVNADGTVNFARYTNGSSYSSITAGAWFPFNLTWIIDD